jgi:hypothetical protein
MDIVAKENADYSPKAIPCLILAMSDVGTKRTCRSPNRMSAFGGRADVSHGAFCEYTPC